MKAFVISKPKSPPQVITYPDPVPKEGESLCLLQAAAFNRRDHWIAIGAYPMISYPSVLGSDGCAIAQDGRFAGQEVIFCPSINWGKNEKHQSLQYSILGMPKDGCFAEQVALPYELLQPKPSHLSPQQAAALPLAGLTAWRALISRAQLQAGEKVLISGAGGGVALFAMQFAIARGAEVYVTSGNQQKIDRAKSMGAQGGVCYHDSKWHKSLPPLFDVIIDSAGGDGFGQLLRLLGMGGRIVFYGGTHGKWPQLLPQHLFFRQISILGSTMGSPKEFKEMCAFVDQHKIVPILDSVFSFEQTNQGMDRLLMKERFGKVVVEIKR